MIEGMPTRRIVLSQKTAPCALRVKVYITVNPNTENVTVARVTKENLNNRLTALNRAFGRPEEPYTLNEDTKRYTPNVGNFHLSEGIGGFELLEMHEDGACRTIFSRDTKAVIYDLMGAMMNGAVLALSTK